MPGSVNLAVSNGVLPKSLCTAFTEKRNWESQSNEYHDGSRQSKALVSTSRKAWSLKKRLNPTLLDALYTFWAANQNTVFYFYSPFEPRSGLAPGSNYDATGVSEAGRYLVRFNSDWSEAVGIARTDVSIDLLETA
jgi:hypothetical protein